MGTKEQIAALELRIARLERLHRSRVRSLQSELSERAGEAARLREALIAKRVISEDDVKQEVPRQDRTVA